MRRLAVPTPARAFEPHEDETVRIPRRGARARQTFAMDVMNAFALFFALLGVSVVAIRAVAFALF